MVADLMLFTARGMTIPFLVMYFGVVRGLGEGRVGAGIAASSINGAIFTLVVGGPIERFGPRRRRCRLPRRPLQPRFPRAP